MRREEARARKEGGRKRNSSSRPTGDIHEERIREREAENAQRERERAKEGEKGRERSSNREIEREGERERSKGFTFISFKLGINPSLHIPHQGQCHQEREKVILWL
jgi:hypothetical protein